jgi:hypothetical protein
MHDKAIALKTVQPVIAGPPSIPLKMLVGPVSCLIFTYYMARIRPGLRKITHNVLNNCRIKEQKLPPAVKWVYLIRAYGADRCLELQAVSRPNFDLSSFSPSVEAMVGNWDFSKMNKEEVLHNYKQNPGAFIPEFVALDDLVEIYMKNPGFHLSFEDFMNEWQEEDNAVECEF